LSAKVCAAARRIRWGFLHGGEDISVSQPTPAQNDVRLGVFAAAAAYIFWGFLPIYLKAVSFADAFEVLAERILFSVPASVLAIVVMSGWAKGWREMRAALKPRLIATLALSSVMIFLNWGIYVWAVANHHVMEAALAYFLAPLAQVLAGVAFFREKLSHVQKIALGFAAAGVIVQGAALGAPPWISLVLCATWVGYAVVRKQAPVAAATGMLIETIILAPLSAAILVWLSHGPGLAFDSSAPNAILLALLGVVTALPLILFSFGARRITFATLGVLQYIAPSLQFLLGVLYGEPLSPLRAVSFVLIWVALVAFTWDSLARNRASKTVTPQIEA
jgi:chloramphenicol-sensitive protein RarD